MPYMAMKETQPEQKSNFFKNLKKSLFDSLTKNKSKEKKLDKIWKKYEKNCSDDNILYKPKPNLRLDLSLNQFQTADCSTKAKSPSITLNLTLESIKEEEELEADKNFKFYEADDESSSVVDSFLDEAIQALDSADTSVESGHSFLNGTIQALDSIISENVTDINGMCSPPKKQINSQKNKRSKKVMKYKDLNVAFINESAGDDIVTFEDETKVEKTSDGTMEVQTQSKAFREVELAAVNEYVGNLVLNAFTLNTNEPPTLLNKPLGLGHSETLESNFTKNKSHLHGQEISDAHTEDSTSTIVTQTNPSIDMKTFQLLDSFPHSSIWPVPYSPFSNTSTEANQGDEVDSRFSPGIKSEEETKMNDVCPPKTTPVYETDLAIV